MRRLLLDIPMIFLQPKICFDHHHVPGVVRHQHHHAGGQDDHAEKTGQDPYHDYQTL